MLNAFLKTLTFLYSNYFIFQGIQIEKEIVSRNSEMKEIIDLEIVGKEPEVTRKVS